jgi:multiple sugar transport system permease protein
MNDSHNGDVHAKSEGAGFIKKVGRVSGLEYRRNQLLILLLLPCMAVLFIMIIYPLLYALVHSFRSFSFMDPGRAHFVGLENFWRVLTTSRSLSSMGVTLEFVGACLGFEFLIGMSLALVLHRGLRGTRFFGPLLMAPMMVSPVVVALLWRYLFFDPDRGLINYYLRILSGVGGPIWLADPRFALLAVIVVEVWQWTPFVTLILFSGLQALPVEPVEAALIDGASRWQVFWHVTFPLLKPIFLVILLFRIVDLFKAFDIIYVMTEGGPGVSTEVFGLLIFRTAFKYTETGYALAQSWILIIVVNLIAIFIIRSLAKETP